MSESAKNITCENCGTENVIGSNFCSNCGFKLAEGNNNNSTTNTNKAKGTNALNPLVVYVSAFAIVVLVAVVLITTGVFDQPEAVKFNGTTSGETGNPHADPHAGGNMQAFQQIKELEQKVAENPDDFASLLNLSHLYNDSGFFTKAIENYNKYLDKNAGDADVWVDMAVCYYSLEQYDLAEQNMKKALEINPKHQIAHFNLGIVKLARGDRESAKEWWKKAVELNPSTKIAERANELLSSH